MTIEASVSELVLASAFLGGQIAVLAGVVRSNRDQGRRLGELEKAIERLETRRDVAKEYQTQRHVAPASGVPITED